MQMTAIYEKLFESLKEALKTVMHGNPRMKSGWNAHLRWISRNWAIEAGLTLFRVASVFLKPS